MYSPLSVDHMGEKVQVILTLQGTFKVVAAGCLVLVTFYLHCSSSGSLFKNWLEIIPLLENFWET